jgi:hypothetical protein
MFSSRALKIAFLLLVTIIVGLTTRSCRESKVRKKQAGVPADVVRMKK